MEQVYIDRAMKWLEGDAARSSLKKRPLYYIEWVFAEAKTLHGLDKIQYRGLEKATIQGLMTASVQNVKRLMNHVKNKSKEVAQNIFGNLFYSYILRRIYVTI